MKRSGHNYNVVLCSCDAVIFIIYPPETYGNKNEFSLKIERQVNLYLQALASDHLKPKIYGTLYNSNTFTLPSH